MSEVISRRIDDLDLEVEVTEVAHPQSHDVAPGCENAGVQILLDDPLGGDVITLLEEHLADMYATSPPESVHALDPTSLTGVDIAFWTLREDGAVLGCAALKRLGPDHGEIKSMRTATAARRRGVAARLLDHVLAEARARAYGRLSLETGTQDFFAPARSLYASRGFVECGPFGTYTLDPNSVFMTLDLACHPGGVLPDQA
jgi:putative acetyltransferase